jgi:hypothetical protein
MVLFRTVKSSNFLKNSTNFHQFDHGLCWQYDSPVRSKSLQSVLCMGWSPSGPQKPRDRRELVGRFSSNLSETLRQDFFDKHKVWSRHGNFPLTTRRAGKLNISTVVILTSLPTTRGRGGCQQRLHTFTYVRSELRYYSIKLYLRLTLYATCINLSW